MSHRLTITAERHAATRLLRLLTVAAIVLPLAVLAGSSLIAWQNQQRDAWDSTTRLTDQIYESISKLFDAQLLALDEAQALTDAFDDAGLQDRAAVLHQRLAMMLTHLPHVRDVFVVGQAGHAIVDGLNYPAPYGNDLNDRDYVRYIKAGGQGVFVSLPGERKIDGQRFFALAIPRSRTQNSYAGVVATSVMPEFFETYFAQAIHAYGAAADRAIALRRFDGALLVRTAVGTHLGAAGDDMIADRVRHSAGDSGRFEVDLPETGQHHLVAWRRMPGVGMVVLSSLNRAAVVRDWTASIVTQLYFGVPVTLALFVITLLALRRTSQAARAAEQVAAEMTRREQAEAVARQSQKMEALGKLTGGVAHDFNNLLAVILGSAELAKRRPPDKVGRLLDNIIHAGQRATTLTRQLLSFSRRQNVAPRTVDLRAELPRMLDLLRPSLRSDIALSLDIADDVWPVEIDPGEFEIALLNVAVNARDAMPAGGCFTITAANRQVTRLEFVGEPTLAGDFVAVSLADTGPGMPPEVATQAFEPFFTTKGIGRGTGLGLSQVYGFARQAGGAAVIDSTPGVGTRIVLLLPRSETPAQPEAAASPIAGQRSTDLRLLLVEDDADVATVATEMVHSLGWEVVVANRAQPALDRLTERFDLLLSDVVMPDGMSGLDLAQAARARRPALPILLMSGYNEVVSASEVAFPVLRKPFTLEQLAAAMRQAMAARPPAMAEG